MIVGDFTDANPGAMPPQQNMMATPQGTPSPTPKTGADDTDPDHKEEDSGVEEDIQTLFNNLANVIGECAEQKDRIDVICTKILKQILLAKKISWLIFIFFCPSAIGRRRPNY